MYRSLCAPITLFGPLLARLWRRYTGILVSCQTASLSSTVDRHAVLLTVTETSELLVKILQPSDDVRFFVFKDILTISIGHTATLAGGFDFQHVASY